MKNNSVKPIPRKKRGPSKQSLMDAERRRLYNEAMNIVYNSGMLSRGAMAGRLGMQFGDERDLYGTFGYKQSLQYDDYRAMYDRTGMGTRVVEKFADDTWAKPPVLIDGESRSDTLDDTKLTPFLKEWKELVKKLQVWQMMRQADVMCGIGRYSVLFLGSSGAYNTPVRAGNGNLFYLSSYDEKQAVIRSLIKDNKSEKFGMPETYNITMDDVSNASTTSTKVTPVHYSRCIHISENRLGSRIYGRPRMQEIYNRLMDLEKVLGGGAEAAWLAIYMGVLLLAREGAEMPEESSPEATRMDEAMQAFAHRVQRYATLTGVDRVENLGVHEVRIYDIYKTLMSDFSGSKGIPQRILLGSERGELASSQDTQEWNGTIKTRRTNFAEPEILDPFVNYCISNKVITPPSNKNWTAEWEPVYTLTQLEEADLLLKISQSANYFTGGASETVMDENEWRRLAHLAPRDLAKILEERQKMEEDLGLNDQGVSIPPSNGQGAGKVAQPPGAVSQPPLNGGQPGVKSKNGKVPVAV